MQPIKVPEDRSLCHGQGGQFLISIFPNVNDANRLSVMTNAVLFIPVKRRAIQRLQTARTRRVRQGKSRLLSKGLTMEALRTLRHVVLLGWMASHVLGGTAMAVEEAVYTVEKSDGDFQLRLYAPQVVAEVLVDGSLEGAGNTAFRPLFNYISGANLTQGKIAMTAPVGQEAVSNRWAVTFMMPGNSTLATLPAPTDERVRLRAIPARRMAAVSYSGTWSRKGYERNLVRLREWMRLNGLVSVGDPVWARYNPPFTPWFLRRNEILLPLASADERTPQAK